MIFRTQFSDSVSKGSKEAFTKPSLTEPDNSMSIPEIIARYTRGQGIPVNQHQWTSGQAAPEAGDPMNDGFMDAVLGVQPSSPAAAPAASPAAAPQEQLQADPEPAPAPAPAGA